MVTYNIDYDYMVEEFGSTVLEADDKEQAEQFALEYVRETYPEACNILITEVSEVGN